MGRRTHNFGKKDEEKRAGIRLTLTCEVKNGILIAHFFL